MASQFSSPIPLPNVSNFLTIKLDRTNYPLWQAQMLPFLRSRNLVSLVDGTSKCHPAFLKDANGNITDTDATVISWINSSIHPTVLAILIGKISSHSAWTTLGNRYTSQSTGRLLQLRSELMNTHRGDSSISEFLDKSNCLVDTLFLCCFYFRLRHRCHHSQQCRPCL
ncbi:hypothetical protein D8674_004200 [Pyrus ussuriensis x Pyrus communis]|uniref:Retrotransposon Copia-like N-terminal domain-containing protein n=1 Tax=Pyrus ussuriensis x Pyrus communis TaxID=2448454 RepID=A0A5N5FJ78_9ROSA|nr:hypothetical protein D8674_004200 [Pyrus ussuriensis x Pyrus communis]